jgi:hypothetical protein
VRTKARKSAFVNGTLISANGATRTRLPLSSYFSTESNSPAGSLTNDAPPACAAHMASDKPSAAATPCRSMLYGIFESGAFFRWTSTVSPWRTRMKLPGAVPPKVQTV